LPGVDTLAPA